ARVLGHPREIGEERLGVDQIRRRAPGVGQGLEDRVQRAARLAVDVADALDHATGGERGAARDEHAVPDAHRARVRVLVFDGAARADAPCGWAGAVDGVELDLDQLFGASEGLYLNERGGRPGVTEAFRERAGRLIGNGDVGDVDARAHDIVEPAAGFAHAPLGDG